jgi:hypothetical protein
MTAALPAENVRQIVEAPRSQLPVQTETGAVISMFERMARDASVPMDRIERVMDMLREMRREQAEEDFNEAMASTQRELTPVARDSFNPQTRSKYASYHAIDKAIRPVYTKHGLGVSFDEDQNPPEGFIRVLAFVSKGRHTKTFHYDSPIVTQGLAGKTMMTLTHARASAVTYAKRYLVGMIFNLSTGEDDDGNTAVNPADTIDDEQIGDLTALIESVSADKARFLKFFKIEQLADLPAKRFQEAVNMLNAKSRA